MLLPLILWRTCHGCRPRHVVGHILDGRRARGLKTCCDRPASRESEVAVAVLVSPLGWSPCSRQRSR
jgi:hypothetical protein